jgi:hypothetical protein
LGARVREQDAWCARVHAGAKTVTEGQNGGGDAATASRTERREWTASELRARGDVGCDSYKKTSQHGTKAVLHIA